jgi:hypothetical protein
MRDSTIFLFSAREGKEGVSMRQKDRFALDVTVNRKR